MLFSENYTTWIKTLDYSKSEYGKEACTSHGDVEYENCGASMNWSRLRNSGNENVFKGSQLVTSILERHNQHFRSRATALKFCRQLFNDGVIRGVFGATTFEDSVQLYAWKDQNGTKMTSHPPVHATSNTPARASRSPGKSYGFSSADVTLTRRELYKQKETIKPIEHTSRDSNAHHNDVPYSHDANNYFRDIQNGISPESDNRLTSHPHMSSYQTSWNLQRASTASSESSVDILSHSYGKHKDKPPTKTSFTMSQMTTSRDHDVIPEETHEDHVPVMERTTTSTDYDGTSSFPRSVTTTDTSTTNDVDVAVHARWQQDYQNSYSDNEKQLIEQMKRMKKEHSHILRTYEDRINKLMAKMHELRSIAEMLENSSTKSSPYGMIHQKNGMLNFLSAKPDHDRKLPFTVGSDGEQPPPLPPRPGRGNRLNPTKPFIQTDAKMKTLAWSRIILHDESGDEQTTIWHTMMEPKIDAEETERLFSTPVASQTDGATLYDDLIIRRGRSRQQLVSIYDTDRSKRIVVCMKCLRATLNDVISCVSSLDTSQINHDGLAELMELLSPSHDIDKILYHVRKKGAGHLDHPEYLVFELSKVDHFKDRVEFIKFRFKLLWHLFEIDQQMRELHTACDEITSSISLKNLLETLLAVGNYLNGATEMGQADGFGLDVLNKIKDLQDRDGKGTLLEFVLKTYCQIYENEVDIGCPTRFRLPEPSNMRHAAQVSFEGIQDALSNIHSDLRHIRERLLDPKVNKDTMRPMDSFRVSAENFFAAALEVISEQEKVLQDTRDVFDRTTAYFLVDKQLVTPQQFFHIWAVFLHDCKYFWKLAHRRLAKERFELEFKYKGQVSASSIQEGYGTFRAGVLKCADSVSTADPKTSTAQRKTNRWMDSPDKQSKPNVPPKPSRSRNPDDVYNPGSSDRSSSPKPLTSSPPSSVDVCKPLPKAPITITAPLSLSSSIQIQPPNYENQSELDRYQHQQQLTGSGMIIKTPTSSQETSPHAGSSTYRSQDSSTMQSTKDKKSQQFSLKTWLKREREQVRKGVESENTEQQTDPKPQSPSKGFSRFKNSMIQRFSSGSSNKKQDVPPKKSKDTKQQISPPSRYDFDTPPGPYDVLRNNYKQQGPVDTFQADLRLPPRDPGMFTTVESEYNRSLSDAVISPIDDPDVDDLALPEQNRYEHQNGVPPQMHVKPEDTSNRYLDSDVNNNDKFGAQDKIKQAWQSGVNETPYVHTSRDRRNLNKDLNNVPRSPEQTFVSPSAESKRVVAQAAPVYKARVINNYENQGKFENPNIVRQQAEPAKPLQLGDTDYNKRHGGTSNQSGKEYGRRPYSLLPTEHSRNKSSDEALQDRQPSAQVGHHRHYNSENSPYGQMSRVSKTPEKSVTKPETPRKRAVLENRNYITPGNRVPMNVQSIGSLIDKFDKYNNNSNVNDDNAPETMTSTPVAVRKTPVLNGDVTEASPPLPPRTPSKSKTRPAPNDNSMTSRYTSPERQSYVSPQIRTDNISSNSHLSPPSVYSTPQGNISQSVPSHSFNHFSPHSSNNNRSHNYYLSPPMNGDINSDSGTVNSPYRDHATNMHHAPSNNQHAPSNTNHQAHDNNQHAPNNNNQIEQTEDRDDGYRAKLRRAANYNHSAFDRYSKNSPQYTGRPSLGSSYIPNQNQYGSPASVKSPVHNNEEVAYMAF